MADIFNIAGQIHSTSEEQTAVIASEVKDEQMDKKQSVINQEVDGQLNTPTTGLEDRVRTLEEGATGSGDIEIETNPSGVVAGSGKVTTANAVRGAIDMATGYFECSTAGATAAKAITGASVTGFVLPTTGGSIKIKMTNRNSAASGVTLNINETGAKAIYYNGAAVSANNTWDVGEIVEVFYDGTRYNAYNVAGGSGDGVFDLSAYNLTEGQPTQYEDLAAALGTNGANVPQQYRKGGMSVKFVQSSDNKYVQYRLMSQTFSTIENDWEKYNEVTTSNQLSTDLDISDEQGNVLVRFTNGHLQVKNFSSADALESIQAILSNIGFDNVPEFDEDADYAIGDIVRYEKYVYVFTSAHTAGEWDDTEVEKTTITFESPVDVTTAESDLDISDEQGNVLVRFTNGHLQVKNFNSSELYEIIEEKMEETHWNGKTWYAYGTSLTNTSNEGKYAKYVQQLSGMNRVNKGISGGALVANRNIYNAIMNVTDGKTEADLITLECLANDASSEFGNVSDTDNTTFLGALGQCIVYLQQNTTAQIVIIPSMRARSSTGGVQFYPYQDEPYYEKCKKIEQLCTMYGVYCINPNVAMGYYRKTNDYYVDNIHHTELGGKAFGEYIWSVLKQIPLWYSVNNN